MILSFIMYLLTVATVDVLSQDLGGTVGSNTKSFSPFEIYRPKWETDECRDSTTVKHRECYEVGSRAAKGCQRRVSPSNFVEGPGRASWKK